MKFILIVLLVFCAACADQSATDKPAPGNTVVNEQIREKNKQVALKNEVTEITRLAQKLEQQGRDMQPYRESSSAESARQCNLIVEERRKETADLEARVKNLPENYRNKLVPIVAEINACVSCAKKGLDDCKKARASVNQVIKELYP